MSKSKVMKYAAAANEIKGKASRKAAKEVTNWHRRNCGHRTNPLLVVGFALAATAAGAVAARCFPKREPKE